MKNLKFNTFGYLAILSFVFFTAFKTPTPPEVVATINMPPCTQTTPIEQIFTVEPCSGGSGSCTYVVEILSTYTCPNQEGVVQIWDGETLISEATFVNADLPLQLSAGDPPTSTSNKKASVHWRTSSN